MSKRDITTAKRLLADRIDRTEAIGADCKGGWAITAYFRDGGQRLFYSLEEVRRFLASHGG